MASGQTSNLALSQWGAADRMTRADFNGDNSKIDAAVGALRAADTTMQGSISTLQGSVSSLQTAVAGKCSVIVGTYTGDGAESRTITLGVTPKAVLVSPTTGQFSTDYYRYAGLALQNSPVAFSAQDPILTIVSGGFTVYVKALSGYDRIFTNNSGQSYNYIAFY